MAVATALLLSVLFLGLQCTYQPFKSLACNRVQQACLTALSLVYFAGLLLKLDAVEATDQDALGVLLVVTLILAVCSVAYVIVAEVAVVRGALRRARHCASVLQTLPQQDPPPDSREFYAIQVVTLFQINFKI